MLSSTVLNMYTVDIKTTKRELRANEGPPIMQPGYRTLSRAAAFAAVVLFAMISRGESRPKLPLI